MSGMRSYRAGLAAEEQVERHYARAGLQICARRWRGSRGEIDLVARNGAEVIFIEVKSSRSHDLAALHLTPAQMRRICGTATEFLAGEPNGQLTAMRIDLVLVDASGRIEVIENAITA
ncbi:MAG: hypothetical protein HC844_21230 [Tabrizicola sp.]|nr:hypothetical protein [Tabrizicola sp.]